MKRKTLFGRAAGVLFAVALVISSLTAPALAQQTGPRIGYVFPAGGRLDSTFKVAVGGQYLATASNAVFSGQGVSAKVESYTRPLTQKEFNTLRDQAKQLQEKRAAAFKAARTGRGRNSQSSSNVVVWTAADEKKMAAIRDKLENFAPRRQANPAIAETVYLRVTVAPDTLPGNRELRLAGPLGLSNPLLFKIGDLPEFTEKEAPVDPGADNERRARFAKQPPKVDPAAEMTITLPAAVNGQIMPGDMDRYRFRAREGTRLVLAASARELIPYLPDAVPGWFQATLALYDSKGKELAYDDDFMFQPDPVLFYRIPKDGEYVVEIKDSIYRGREDFVYRLLVGEVPFVTGIFPLGGPVGVSNVVGLDGYNLAEKQVTLNLKEPGIHPVAVGGTNGAANTFLFAVDTLNEVVDKENNNSVTQAQGITLPLCVNGRIDAPGDVDYFRFEGRAGEEIIAEIQARRLNSPVDSVLKLADAAGVQLAFNDDSEDKGAGLTTHHADSRIHMKLPADGIYYLSVSDAQQKGGHNYAYRLRASGPRPDFELRVVPAQVGLRGGGTVPLTVYALRRDGFTNEITLRVNDDEYKLGGARIPAGQDKVQFTLTAPPNPTRGPVSLKLEGTAVVGGAVLTRPVVPAEDMMQAFFYRHLVPAQEFKVAVSGRWMWRGSVRVLGQTPVRIPAGGTALVQVSTGGSGTGNQLQLELSDPPEGVAIRQVSATRTGAEIVLECDKQKAVPGLKGNLIVQAYGSRPGADKNKQQTRRVPVGTLPAIPFEIVGQ